MSVDSSPQPLVSKKGIVIDLILTVLFFLFMREVLIPHVPSQDPLAVNIVSSMTSFCMSGVFWLAAGMFRVTLVDYQKSQQQQD
jgi:heme/copper-type cytochrome/quinol oxidase subunit 2